MKRQVTIRILALLLVCACWFGWSGTVWAQMGKLAGRITEEGTDQALPGANVVLDGTLIGTATDEDGRYVLIGIQPGTYNVRISSVGFTTKIVEGVLITSDRTTTLDETLSEEVVQGQEVVILADRPVVDPNQTTSRSLVTKAEISRLPAGDLQDVIARTANSYEGFVRGSRRFETKTILEGIDVSDAYYAVGYGAYGGLTYHNTNRIDDVNASIFTINPDAVEEVTVNAGATPSRYTSASGGVVTVSLSEGRGPIRGTLSARVSPEIQRPGPDSLDFYIDAQRYLDERATLMAGDDAAQQKAAKYTWTPDKYDIGGDPEIDIRGSLGGSITSKWNFLASGQWFQTNGYLPNYFQRRLGGQLKTTYDIGTNTKISAIGLFEDKGLWGNWNNRSYQDYWRFYLEGVAQNDGGSYLGSLKLTQIFSEKAFLEAQVYRTFQRDRYGYPDDDGNGRTDPGEDGEFIDFLDPNVITNYIGVLTDRSKMFYEKISDPISDSGIFLPDGTRYKIANPVPYFEDALLATNGFKLDYTNQFTLNHLIQAGAEVKLRSFSYDEIYGIDVVTLNGTEEPYVPRSYDRKPWELSLYASDRMEYAGLIVNLGVRLDFVNRDTEKINDYFYPFRRDTVEVNGRQLARNFFDRGEAVPTDVFFNPSIGISYPIGTTAAMYFSYSRAQQLVPYSILYRYYDGNHSPSRFFTYQDPEQEPITSNNYELGVQWEFLQGWGFDVNAYMRSIENYGRAALNANNRTPQGQPSLTGLDIHTYETSFGYADVRGIELVLRRRPLQLAQDFSLGLTGSYTFSSVEQANLVGGVNVADFAYNDETGTQIPFEVVRDFKHFPQNVRGGTSIIDAGFDRRHRGVLRAVIGLPLEFSMGISAAIESGFLYPRAIGVDPRQRELLTGPTNYQIDLRFEKRFPFNNRFGVDFYFDVKNLTNRRNVIAYEANTPSGPVLFQEQGIPGSRLIQNDGSPLYGTPLNIYFGTRLRF